MPGTKKTCKERFGPSTLSPAKTYNIGISSRIRAVPANWKGPSSCYRASVPLKGHRFPLRPTVPPTWGPSELFRCWSSLSVFNCTGPRVPLIIQVLAGPNLYLGGAEGIKQSLCFPSCRAKKERFWKSCLGGRGRGAWLEGWPTRLCVRARGQKPQISVPECSHECISWKEPHFKRCANSCQKTRKGVKSMSKSVFGDLNARASPLVGVLQSQFWT